MDNYVGVKFLGYDLFECEVIIKRQNDYLVKDSLRARDDGAFCSIMTTEDIKDLLSKQDKLKEKKVGREQREKEETQKEIQEIRLKQDKENLFGFTDNKTDLQKGKILTTLMKTMLYNGNMITRKDFVISQLKAGYTPEIKEYKKRNKGKEGILKAYYVLYNHNNDSWIDVTKTEYDFAKYILSNNISISL